MRNKDLAVLILIIVIVLAVLVLILTSERRHAAQYQDDQGDDCRTIPEVIPEGPECPTSLMDEACGDVIFSGLPSYSANFDLKPSITPGGPAIDWSTLTIDNTEVFTANMLESDYSYNCSDGVNGQVPYGTHQFRTTSLPHDLCAPGTQLSPTSYQFDGCVNVGGAPAGSDGETYTADWFHLGNGVLNLVMDTTWIGMVFHSSWQITYTVEDVNGCSYTHQAYFYTTMPL